MSIIQKAYTFRSKTGECDIYARTYIPQGQVKAVVQIHHGMAEHMERYKDFIDYLCNHSFGVIIHDMANHGKSNQDANKLGYFGEKNGWKNLVEDMKQVYNIGRKEFGDLPYIVFGHSMGSLVARCFVGKYGDVINGAVFCGTSGSNPLALFSIGITNVYSLTKGKLYRSSVLDKIGFGTFNDMFEKRTNFDWLTRDQKIVDEYINDDLCGYLFVTQGYNDLANFVLSTNAPSWYKAVPPTLPITLISGEMDPVGNYGKGVEEVYNKLKREHINVSMKLYGNARHEILNETMKESVYQDVVNWIENAVLNK